MNLNTHSEFNVRYALGKEDRTVKNMEPYIQRPVEFLKQVSSGGWRIKVYGISAKSKPLSKELVSEGIQIVLPHLPQLSKMHTTAFVARYLKGKK